MPLLISQLPKAEIETKASIKPKLVPEEGEVSQLWGSVQKSQVIIIKNMRMPLYSFKMTLYWHEGSFCHSTSPISTSLKCSTLFLWWSSKPFPFFLPLPMISSGNCGFLLRGLLLTGQMCPLVPKAWGEDLEIQMDRDAVAVSGGVVGGLGGGGEVRR